MAVVATLSRGYDLDYIWKQVDRGPAKDAASYYIHASETGENHPAAGGDPARELLAWSPARWSSARRMSCCSANAVPPTAPGWAGLHVMAAKPPTYTRSCWPPAARHRRTQTRTADRGRQAGPPMSPLLRPDPVAVQEHLALPRLPRRERPPGPPGGDKDGDQYWSALVAEVDEMVWQAVHSGFDYFQREAGYTRTGGPSHGGRQREGRPSAVGPAIGVSSRHCQHRPRAI